VCNVLKMWVDNHFDDFDKHMIARLFSFINDTMALDGYQKLANQLDDVLKSKINGVSFQKPTYVILRDNKIKLPITLHELDDEALIRVAQHFTLIEFGIYSSVKTSELLGVYWEDDKKKHLAPNIKALISRFNMVAFWVTSMILKTQPKVEDRAKVITHLIKVAEHLRNMNNFQTLNSFLSGLNSSAVKKLKASLSMVPQDSLQKLANLTEFMKKEVFLEALNHVRPPVIPFIGYFQSMLVGIELMADKVNDAVNFSKYSKHYKCICDILQGQLNPYKFKLVPRLFHYCSLLSDRESEQEIDKIATLLEKEETRIAESFVVATK